MPFAFPAHAAAAIPICRLTPTLFHSTALVVGTCAPDLVYVVSRSDLGSHSLSGLFTVCLPLGILALLWAEGLVLPWLASVVPSMLGIDWPKVLRPVGLPRGWRQLGGSVLALVLGAMSHLLWDGLTHAGWWPARAIYGDVTLWIAGRPHHMTGLLWQASSLLGSLLVVVYLLGTFPAQVSPRGGQLFLAVGAFVATVAGAVAPVVRLRTAPDHVDTWGCYTSAATWAFIAFTTVCSVGRLVTALRGPRSQGPRASLGDR